MYIFASKFFTIWHMYTMWNDQICRVNNLIINPFLTARLFQRYFTGHHYSLLTTCVLLTVVVINAVATVYVGCFFFTDKRIQSQQVQLTYRPHTCYFESLELKYLTGATEFSSRSRFQDFNPLWQERNGSVIDLVLHGRSLHLWTIHITWTRRQRPQAGNRDSYNFQILSPTDFLHQQGLMNP